MTETYSRPTWTARWRRHSLTPWPRRTETYGRSATAAGDDAVRSYSVLANATAKPQDGRYPRVAPPTLEAVEDSRTVGTAARRAPHPRERLAG